MKKYLKTVLVDFYESMKRYALFCLALNALLDFLLEDYHVYMAFLYFSLGVLIPALIIPFFNKKKSI